MSWKLAKRIFQLIGSLCLLRLQNSNNFLKSIHFLIFFISVEEFQVGRFPHSLFQKYSKQDFGKKTGKFGKVSGILHRFVHSPTHTRPLESSVRPSGHWHLKEPLVFTQYPLGHTPGKTTHSFTSTASRERQKVQR